MLVCSYCGEQFDVFRQYKCHLKVMHNKRTVGDRLVCGQDNCPLDYVSAWSLQKHIERQHGHRDSENTIYALTSPINGVNVMEIADEVTASASTSSDCVQTEDEIDSVQFINSIRQEIYSQGAIGDAARFISRLRSNPKVPLSVCLEVIESCKDLFVSCMSTVKMQCSAVLHENNVTNEKATELLDTISLLENPFIGLETLHKQTKYFEKNGFFIKPYSCIVGQCIKPVVSSDGTSYRTQSLTVEYVRQLDFFKAFLTIPGVLHEIISYLSTERPDDLICDFKDGSLWKNHPIRLAHISSPNTVVIPVFDFCDDLETVNPLGSHISIHKVGCKYTIIKGLKPACNSKLENLPLNMVFKSSHRTSLSNQQIFDVYMSEMSALETEGFRVQVDGLTYQDLDDANSQIEVLHKRYGPMQLTVQPLVAHAGDTFIVCYNTYRWCFDTSVKAIDVCFKLINVLNLSYNVASMPAWIFLQKYVFGFTTAFDGPSPKAAELAAQIDM